MVKNASVTNIIRPLASMTESIIISFTSVDTIQCNGFADFKSHLLGIIIDYLGAFNYRAKNRYRLITGLGF